LTHDHRIRAAPSHDLHEPGRRCALSCKPTTHSSSLSSRSLTESPWQSAGASARRSAVGRVSASVASSTSSSAAVLDLDLTPEQLAALAHAVTAAGLERHRHQEMDVDDVLAMRRLLSLGDGFAHMAARGAINTVRLSADEARTLRGALSGWLDDIRQRGWQRDDDRDAAPVAQDILRSCWAPAGAVM